MYKRYYSREDYEMLADWWRAWKWDVVPIEFLPPMGIVIGDEKEDICAVFLYRTDTPIVWAENFISNPDVRGIRRKEAMDMLIKEIEHETKELGYTVVMSAIKHDNLAQKLEANDYTKADEGLTHYIKGCS